MSFLSETFLNEPAYKWVIFLCLIMIFMAAWKMILGYM